MALFIFVTTYVKLASAIEEYHIPDTLYHAVLHFALRLLHTHIKQLNYYLTLSKIIYISVHILLTFSKFSVYVFKPFCTKNKLSKRCQRP